MKSSMESVDACLWLSPYCPNDVGSLILFLRLLLQCPIDIDVSMFVRTGNTDPSRPTCERRNNQHKFGCTGSFDQVFRWSLFLRLTQVFRLMRSSLVSRGLSSSYNVFYVSPVFPNSSHKMYHRLTKSSLILQCLPSSHKIYHRFHVSASNRFSNHFFCHQISSLIKPQIISVDR